MSAFIKTLFSFVHMKFDNLPKTGNLFPPSQNEEGNQKYICNFKTSNQNMFAIFLVYLAVFLIHIQLVNILIYLRQLFYLIFLVYHRNLSFLRN